jgi:hypothetical protein
MNSTNFYTLIKLFLKEVIMISFLGAVTAPFIYLWDLFLHWLSIFISPVQEPEMLWIIVPIWINWFFTEFFQEKHGTSFGNAIGNGAIAIFSSIDWFRYMIRLIEEGIMKFTFGVFMKFFLAVLVFAYGIFVIIAGIKIKRIVFFIGKIRWVTYVLLMFTPIVYNVIRFNFKTFLAIVLFFPLYYWVIEIFDRITPEPKVYSHNS